MKTPALNCLHKTLQKFIDDPYQWGSGVTIAKKLKSALEKRFPQYISIMPDAACTFVNPRYKSIYFSQDQQRSVINSLQQYYDDFQVSVETQHQSQSQHQLQHEYEQSQLAAAANTSTGRLW